MPPKRKAVKQVESSDDESEKTSIFHGSTFSIVGRLSQTQSALTELIEQNGGEVSKTISSDTTHVISTQGEVDKGNTKLKNLEKGVHLVSESFLHESIKKGCLLPEDDYVLTAKVESEEEEEEDEEYEEKPKKKTAKTTKKSKKAESSEEEEEEEEEEEKPKSKRKAAATKEKKSTTKKAKGKQEEEEEEEEVEEESEGLKAEKEKKSKEAESVKTVTITKKGRAVVDPKCSVASSCHVIDQGGVVYDATLNQTDVTYGVKGHNKFYIAQALEADSGNKWYCWTRWGRVGATGQSKLEPCGSSAAAIKAFEKKFYEKTKNQWANRANFKPVKGKYDLIEMDHGNEEEEEEEEKDVESELEKKRQARSKGASTTSSSNLDPRVQELIKLIFDLTMFEQTLMSYDIDVKKMPLGRISKNQIAKGYEILESIEELFNEDENPSKSQLADLCNRFYTVIPHDFSFKKPPIISTLEELQNKMDLLEVLGDIEVAQNLIDKEKKQKSEENPIDAKYKVLNNTITAVDKDSDEWKRVETYLKNTSESYKLTLLDLYCVNRNNEQEAFSKFDHIKERKLLWHGSKVAVFPSILSGGLKIMPHSGGRVGRGLYFADIVAKSASYCGLHNNIGLILLNEVALGKSHEITKDDPSLTKAPKGFDSVLAKGFKQVDDSKDYADTKLSHTDHPVIIPQGKIEQKTLSSSFMHNEYLVYDSAQVSMKYLLRLKWN